MQEAKTLSEAVSSNLVSQLYHQSAAILEKTNYYIPNPYFDSDATQAPLVGRRDISLIHIAAYCDCLECYIYLEENTDLNFSTKSSSSQNCLYYCCAGFGTEVLSYIINQCQKDKNKMELLKKAFYEDYKLETNLLSLAVFAASNDTLHILFENGYGIDQKGIDRRNELVSKPIHISIKRKRPDCLTTLLRYKHTSSHELSPLQMAISAGVNDAIPILMDTNIRLDYMTPSRETALSVACMVGNVEAVRMLCERMTDIDIPATERAPSAVHWMCRSSNPTIVKLMLQRQPDLSRLDQAGKPGITYLSQSKNVNDLLQILDMLEESGYNMNDPKNPAIGVFLTGIKPNPKLIEWCLKRNVDLDIPFKRTTLPCNKTIRETILEKRKIKEFRELIEKYHLDPKA